MRFYFLLFMDIGELHYSQTKWAYVLHDKDVSKKSPSELTDPHVHIVMRFCNGVNSMYLFKQFPGAYIETAQNVKGAIRYLIHLDDKDKAQYSVDCVKSNYDPECLSEILCELSSKESMRKEPSKSDLDGVLDRIVQGEIRQYNLDVFKRLKCQKDNPTISYIQKKKINNKKSILDILNLPSISLTSNEFGNNNDERMDCNG